MSDKQHVVMTSDQVRDLIKATVRETFVTLGVDPNDPIEVQKDFQHLRDWRETTDSIKSKGILALVGMAISGAAAAAWLGAKQMLSP